MPPPSQCARKGRMLSLLSSPSFPFPLYPLPHVPRSVYIFQFQKLGFWEVHNFSWINYVILGFMRQRTLMFFSGKQIWLILRNLQKLMEKSIFVKFAVKKCHWSDYCAIIFFAMIVGLRISPKRCLLVVILIAF